MSFRKKVQTIVLEMSEGQKLKEIKNDLLNSISAELMKRHEEVIMKSLEQWKEDTIKAAVKDILAAMPDEEKKEILSPD